MAANGGGRRQTEEKEDGFSDYVWQHTADRLLKQECAFRDRYVQRETASLDASLRIDEVYAEQARLAAEVQKNFEVSTGRFDRLE